jgi:2-dehydropantoate 2-reductase
MGAGAVGCYFGGMLGRNGHKVTLIGRPDHVQAIELNGLLMDCLNFKEYVKVRATTELDVLAHADIVLFCVKSPDTTATIQMMQKYLKSDAVILSLQNGVDNCNRIRALIQNPVIPAVVYVATAMQAPGELKHHGRGELVIGNWEPHPSHPVQNLTLLNTLSELFIKAAVPCTISSDIRNELWGKFLVNCCYNAISAIGQIQYGKMAQVEPIKSLIEELAKEVILIANKEGIEITQDQARQANDQIVQTMATQRSSTAQDIARKKATEIDYLNGFIVRKGKEHGIATPANQSVFALIKMIEQFND